MVLHSSLIVRWRIFYSNISQLKERFSMKRFALGGMLAAAAMGCGGSDPAEEPSVTDPGSTGTTTPACENSLTDYDGDCLALEEPDASVGFQLHYGPSDYSDPDEIEKYLLQPGDEVTDCLYMTTPNDEDVYYEEYHARMRPGTHHLIIFGGQASVDEPDGTLGPCNFGPDFQFLVGAQSGIGPDGGRIDIPGDMPVAPENEGLVAVLGAHTKIAFQMHYVNNGKHPILREAWANFVIAKQEQITGVMAPVTFLGGLAMNVPPHTKTTIDGDCSIPEDGPEELRIAGLTGHMHAHATRFTVWHTPKGGERQRIYETFDWAEPELISYDSITKNPVPDAGAGTGGGTSGQLWVKKGDLIEWQCAVDNTLDEPLRFGNEAYTAEMCNLFGSYTPSMGGQWRCMAF
jgi:hypothetical protein